MTYEIDTERIRLTAKNTITIADQVGGYIGKIRTAASEGSGEAILGNPAALADQPGVLNSIASSLNLIVSDVIASDNGWSFCAPELAAAMDGLGAWVADNEDPATEQEWSLRIRGLLEQGNTSGPEGVVPTTLAGLPESLVEIYWNSLTADDRAQLVNDYPDLFGDRVAPVLPSPTEVFNQMLGLDGTDGYGNNGYLAYGSDLEEWLRDTNRDNIYGSGSYYDMNGWISSPTNVLPFTSVTGAGPLPDRADGMVYIVVGRGYDSSRDKLEFNTFGKWSVSEMLGEMCGAVPVVGPVTGRACSEGASAITGEIEHDDYVYPATVIAAPIDHSGTIMGEPTITTVEIRMPNDSDSMATARENEDGISGQGPVAPVVGDVIFEMEDVDKIYSTQNYPGG